MDLVLAALVFMSVLAFAMHFAVGRTGETAIRRRLFERIARPSVSDDEEILRATRAARRYDLRGSLFRFLETINLAQKFEQHLWQAGIYRRASDVVLLMMLLFMAGATVGWVLWGDTTIALAMSIGFGAAPLLYVSMRRRRRLRTFNRQLPFALDLIKSSLEAGHSLLRGLQVVVGEFQEPIATEFRSVIEQSQLGLPLPRALEEMLKRVPEEDLRLLVVAVKVQSEVGSSLAQIIGRLSEIVRTRQRIEAQIRAVTAQSRLSGWIIGFLPIVILAAFSVIQPSYTNLLLHDPSGIKILKLAAVLDALAFISIRKILKVRF